jgi:DNA-binding transcriptional regulator YiaG
MTTCTCPGIAPTNVTREVVFGSRRVAGIPHVRWLCPDCAEEVIEALELERVQLHAALVVLVDLPPEQVQGTDIKLARKALGMIQTEMARVTGYEAETLSRFENDRKPIPAIYILALRALLAQAVAPRPGEAHLVQRAA